MKKYTLEVDAKVKGQKDIDKLNESVQDTTESTEEAGQGFEAMGGAADKATGGAVSGFMALKQGIVGTIRQLGVMKAAVAATGLGALLLVIVSIKQAFTSSEEGQNKYNKLLNALGVIVGNITDLLSKFGMTIIEAFENPQQAIKDLWQAIKDNIVVRIQSTIDMFGFLGKAIKAVFEGDWKGAMEAGKQAALKFVDANTGVKNTVEKLKEETENLVNEMKEEIAISNELSDLQAKLRKDERKALVERAKLEGQIADLRNEYYDEENNSVLDRMKFLEQAMTLNDQIYAQEEELARIRLQIKREQNALSNSTQDDLMEEARLEAELIRLTKERADRQRELLSQLASLRKQYLTQIEADGQVEIDIDQDINDSIESMNVEAYEHDVENYKATADAKQKIDAQSFSNALGAISQMFNMLGDAYANDFEKQKKFKIAAAWISGIQGAVNAFTSASSIPVVGTAIGAVLAAATLAMTAMNVSKMKAVTPSGGGSAGGGGSAPSASAGGIPRITAPSQQQISPMTTGEQAISESVAEVKPSKTYVTSTDVSSQQELDRKIETKASI